MVVRPYTSPPLQEATDSRLDETPHRKEESALDNKIKQEELNIAAQEIGPNVISTSHMYNSKFIGLEI